MSNEQTKAKELAELLNAFADGKQLQIFYPPFNVWGELLNQTSESIIQLFTDDRRLRIKPEKKTSRIPLSREDILDRSKLGFEAMWITDNGKDYSLIVGISHDGVYRRTGFITFREMMQRYTFSLDNTPCYKEVEDE